VARGKEEAATVMAGASWSRASGGSSEGTRGGGREVPSCGFSDLANSSLSEAAGLGDLAQASLRDAVGRGREALAEVRSAFESSPQAWSCGGGLAGPLLEEKETEAVAPRSPKLSKASPSPSSHRAVPKTVSMTAEPESPKKPVSTAAEPDGNEFVLAQEDEDRGFLSFSPPRPPLRPHATVPRGVTALTEEVLCGLVYGDSGCPEGSSESAADRGRDVEA